MPSIINLKFKGNKSFIAFSNLGDVDSLTKTWKVCTKVAGYLEQGQRLENLSWRLWHLQNLMVDTDNAKSKREFRKLSKTMGDKLDKEKGRSIEELEAPGFKRNSSTELLRARAAEKERTREAQQHSRPGTITRMQFTFAVDAPDAAEPARAQHVPKPNFKPSTQFYARRRPSTRAAVRAADDAVSPSTAPTSAPAPNSPTGIDPQTTDPTPTTATTASATDAPLTQRGRKPLLPPDDLASLRFPSLFSSDFGPTALLYASPTLANGNTYGEGVRGGNGTDAFSVVRPTIELPLDELLIEADSPAPAGASEWHSAAPHHAQTQEAQMDTSLDAPAHAHASMDAHSHAPMDTAPAHAPMDASAHAPFDVRAALVARQTADAPPQPTVSPSKLGSGVSTTLRPVLNVRTAGNGNGNSNANASSNSTNGTRAMGPTSAGGVGGGNNTAPGGAKAECSNCGATHTPLWRRGLNDELNCNACGLYCKLHKRPRPRTMRNSHAGETRSSAAAAATAARQEAAESIPLAQCYNCHTTATPLWRKDEEGKTVCNACGLYYKLHGSARPISMKSDVIRKRSRHDARRPGAPASETPSASPGASRRASPNSADAPPSPSQTWANANASANATNGTTISGSEFGDAYSALIYPGPYHPDYLASMFGHGGAGAGSGATGGAEEEDDGRAAKRRRLSGASVEQPPSSAVSYGTTAAYSDASTGASDGSATAFSADGGAYGGDASYGSGDNSGAYGGEGAGNAYGDGSSGTTFGGGDGNAFGGDNNAFAEQPQHAPLDMPFGNYYGNMLRGGAFWHSPAALLPPTHSPQFVHPPMLPPDEHAYGYPLPQSAHSQQQQQSGQQQHGGHGEYAGTPYGPQPRDAGKDADAGEAALFNAYLHPPMMLPDDGTPLLPHPPMFPADWNDGAGAGVAN